MLDANSLLGAQGFQVNTLSLIYKNMVYKLTSMILYIYIYIIYIDDCPTGYTKLDSQICYADHCTACATEGECTTCEASYQKSLWYASTKAEYCTLSDQPEGDVIGRIGVRSPSNIYIYIYIYILVCPGNGQRKLLH